MPGLIGRREFVRGMTMAVTTASSRELQAITPPFALGVCARLWGVSDQYLNSALAAIKSSRFTHVRWEIPWKIIELRSGDLRIPAQCMRVADELQKMGKKSVLILGYGNPLYDNGDKPQSRDGIRAFSRMAAFVSRCLGDHIDTFEIWNEWDTKNGDTSYISVNPYVDLVIEAGAEIRSNAAQSRIIAGGFSAFTYERFAYRRESDLYVDAFLKAVSGMEIDAISVHPYVRGLPYQKTVDRLSQFMLAIVRHIRSYPGTDGLDILATEVGWTTGGRSKDAVSEHEQSRLIGSAIQLAKRNGYAGAFVYQLQDSDPSELYGIYRRDWHPKPAARPLSLTEDEL